jgi:hypothetical protein
MEKTTVLARLRVTLDFSREAQDWLQRLPDVWFASQGGTSFLAEFGGTWERLFLEAAEPEIKGYLTELGVPEEHIPQVRAGERYRGSWVLEAAVVMAGTVGTAYTVFKGISELPEIADGLTRLKERILKRFHPRIDGQVRKELEACSTRNAGSPQISPPPKRLVDVDLVIDARPVLSLTPALMKGHRIYLSVAVSRDSFTLENLGDEPMRDIRLGLFRTETERHQWAYQDSYIGEIPLLSGRQTVAKTLGEFRDRAGNRLDMSDGAAAFVDCWIEDRAGIYLFRFYLEKE